MSLNITEPSSTYCPLPWVHIHVQSDGVVAPCCLYQEKVELNNSFDNLKQRMLAGETISDCEVCYVDEKCSSRSLRTNSIQKYGVVLDSTLKSAEIAFDNVCNLKCRGCGSISSHLWYDDEISLFGTPMITEKYSKHNVYDTININELEKIAVHGGEPFLSPNFKIFCDKILNASNLKEVEITTNGTLLPNDSLSKLLLNIDSLILKISVDGIGYLNDYFRSESNFQEIVNNLKFFDSLYDLRINKKTTIIISTTVSIYNVNCLDEIDQYFKQNFPRVILNKHLLFSPPYMSIKNLPKKYKYQLTEKLDQYPAIKNYLTQPSDNLFDYFIFINDQIDKLRNTNLKEANLQLSEFVEEYKNTDYDLQNALDLQKTHISVLNDRRNKYVKASND
jgi:MoaA/NifB/PqqE/SkfB family radical SAM enzyme